MRLLHGLVVLILTSCSTFLALDLGGTNLYVSLHLGVNHSISFCYQSRLPSRAQRRQDFFAQSTKIQGFRYIKDWGSLGVVWYARQHLRPFFLSHTNTDYLADSVDAFLTSNAEKDTSSAHGLDQPDVLPLGLTFSFPVEQTALDSGKILTWTKGFAAKHAIGNDVVQLLQNAFNRKHMHVKCVALVNDVRSYSSLHLIVPLTST